MDQPVTLEKAITAIKTAAEEIPAEDFISFSTILDVHLSWALQEFAPEDQYELLKFLGATLKTHEELARDISWDLISVLLPFLESPLPATVEEAQNNLSLAAEKGNPREVFIKILEALSSLSWTPASQSLESDGEEDDEDQPEGKDEDISSSHAEKQDTEKEAAQNALLKFNALISALASLHPRISTKFPSRFLSTELTTLLSMFMKAVESLERDQVDGVLKKILNFVQLVKPNVPGSRKQSIATGERPPLPPRTSTTSGSITSSEKEPAGGSAGDKDAEERLLQARLLLSFLTHLLEIYLIRTRRDCTASLSSPQAEGHHNHSPLLAFDVPEARGLVLGWAGKYDANVVRKGKSKVPGGITAIDKERAERDENGDFKAIFQEINNLCDELGVKTEELLKRCETIEDLPNEESEHDHTIPPPNSADDIPLSKHGSLFLLAERLSSIPPSFSPKSSIHVFPNHEHITRNFLVLGPGQSQPPVIDAVLFLGALALHENGLGDVPHEIEDFLIYLQNFGVISASSPSPQARFLAHHHTASCLRKHSDEAVRLAYVKDTLEHCPFEVLKAAVVGILKDEIIYATVSLPPMHEDLASSAPGSPSSLFATPIVIEELFPVLFLDIDQILSGGAERNWQTFKTLYPTLIAIVNLYYFLLLSPATRDRLQVSRKEHADKVEQRFLGPLRSAVKVFQGREDTDGRMELDVLDDVLERVEETKKQWVHVG